MKLLLIEDDRSTVESIKLCFEIYEPDSTVVSAYKGLDGLRLFKNEKFDGVIIDLGLPDIDGTAVIEQLRSFSPIPIVVLSARQNPESISKALEMGANHYIVKPFNYRLLLNKLRDMLDQPIHVNP